MTTFNEIVTLAGGTIFTASCVKKNGERRKFICRLGVKRYLKGGELPFSAEEHDLLPVFDMKKRAYRMINLRTLTHLRIRGKTLINEIH